VRTGPTSISVSRQVTTSTTGSRSSFGANQRSIARVPGSAHWASSSTISDAPTVSASNAAMPSACWKDTESESITGGVGPGEAATGTNPPRAGYRAPIARSVTESTPASSSTNACVHGHEVGDPPVG
jgi:hypothetical protein